MTSLSDHIPALRSFLADDELLQPGSAAYDAETHYWSSYNNPKPLLVVRPKSTTTLQKSVKYLCDSDLDFAVRTGGIGIAGTQDVVLSLKAFDGFEIDRGEETVTIGAGQTWGDVDRKVKEVAEGFTVLSTTGPFVGVAGSIVFGVRSWFTGEHGFGADPKNLLDAQVALPDGRLIWASTEPDLLWALRGGGGNFGVLCAVKIKLYPYSGKIHGGVIIYPRSSIKAVSKGVSDFVNRFTDPKLSAHVMVTDFEFRTAKGGIAEPSVGLLIFDANGEEHGRSEAGFKWAFDIEGAVDMTKEVDIQGMNDMQAKSPLGGLVELLSGPLVDNIDPDFVVRMVEYVERAVETNPALGAGTVAMLEIIGKNGFTSSGGPSMTAWPHSTPKHMLLLGSGFMPGADCSTELALKVLEKGAGEIDPGHKADQYAPVLIHHFNDLSQIFGANYEKLRRIKTKYDPKGRLNKGLFIPPL
ncbi:hypothetical protein FQN50_007970 [Emmonsiellopsis sp. PD_5]|nr:hypothetical protein FQN50_007970 [Emmonsiellopsis sp. PD_5]